MTIRIACNLILDCCGILILLLFLLPLFIRKQTGGFNRQKMNWLLYSAIIHLFVLVILLAESVCLLASNAEQAAGVCRLLAGVMNILSGVFLLLCLFCDDRGVIRIPRGQQIPLRQIICAVLPPTLAFCLLFLLPGYHLAAFSWAVSLSLNHALIMIDSEKKLAETEIHLGLTQAAQMTVQMQPHFIFNTLSAIESLCLTDPQAAAESVENLAGYLRGNMDALTSEGLIPFDTEMHHIRQYIALEQADPSRQFSFDYELNIRDFSLPALTVQPIVENAVKHGALTRRDGSGRVMLTTEQIGRMIRITVTDNGTGNDDLTETQKEKKGIGIESTGKRLETLCNGSLRIFSDEHGTRAVILIPKQGG